MTNDGYLGQQSMADDNGEFNQKAFLVKTMLSKLNIATPVQVVAVYPTGTDSPQGTGTVDVLPLIGRVDGSGVIWPATTIFGLPYFRTQGGIAAVIVDPQVNDIGLAIFCDRDISAFKTTNKAAGPASNRRFDKADGIYIGGWMPAVVPTNYLLVSQDELTAVVGAVTMVMNSSSITSTVGSTVLLQNASGFTLTGNTKVVGTFETTGNTTIDANLSIAGSIAGGTAGGSPTSTFQGSFTATGDIKGSGTSLHTHTHSGVTSGSGNTGGPN